MPTSTEVDAILKDDYKQWRENLNQNSWLLAQIETKRDTVEGRVAKHSVHTGRSGGIGARRENVALPTAGRQRHRVVPVPVRWQTGRIQLTVQLMKMADSQAGAFVDGLESEMMIQKDLMRDVNRQAWGTSNGVMATCGTTSASATIQLLASTTATQMRHFYPGRIIDVGTVASPQTVTSAREITAVDTTNKTITVTGATLSTTSGTHFIFNNNAGGATNNSGLQDDGQSELTGMQTIVLDSGILHTIDSSAEPVWRAQRYSNSGTLRPISDTGIDLAVMNNNVESGDTISSLVSNVGVFAAGKNSLAAYNRNVDTIDFQGGFRGIKWFTPGVGGVNGGEVGWYVDYDAPANTLYGINFDALVCHQIAEGWEWMDDDGAVLSRVQNQLAYEAVLYTSLELGTKQRNAHFVIQDLSEATF